MQTALATIVSATFDGRVFDKAHCLRVFEQHYERVRRTVPAERLLVYRVQDGWEPLCRFLGVDVPDEPFPRVNVGDNLRAQHPYGDATGQGKHGRGGLALTLITSRGGDSSNLLQT